MLARNGRVVVIGSRGRVEIDPRKTMGVDGAILGMTLFNADRAGVPRDPLGHRRRARERDADAGGGEGDAARRRGRVARRGDGTGRDGKDRPGAVAAAAVARTGLRRAGERAGARHAPPAPSPSSTRACRLRQRQGRPARRQSGTSAVVSDGMPPSSFRHRSSSVARRSRWSVTGRRCQSSCRSSNAGRRRRSSRQSFAGSSGLPPIEPPPFEPPRSLPPSGVTGEPPVRSNGVGAGGERRRPPGPTPAGQEPRHSECRLRAPGRQPRSLARRQERHVRQAAGIRARLAIVLESRARSCPAPPTAAHRPPPAAARDPTPGCRSGRGSRSRRR